MSDLKLSLEGENADVAANQLLKTTGLQGSWEMARKDSQTKDGTLAVIATIVGITCGTTTVAEQIRKWYLEHKKSQRTFNVVLVVDDIRLVLEDASSEDIKAVLDELKG